MQIELIVVGKTDSKEVGALVEMYLKRINHYCRFAITTIPDLRNTKSLTTAQQSRSEGERILALVQESDFVVLLDERGAEHRSVEFAEWMGKRMNSGYTVYSYRRSSVERMCSRHVSHMPMYLQAMYRPQDP